MTTYSTHNEKKVDFMGTSHVGTVNCDYNKLVALFGEPDFGDSYRSDAEWDIEFHDEAKTVACIYNWQNGINYLGRDGTDTPFITSWHVGGKTQRALELVIQLLEENTTDVIRAKLHAKIQQQQAEFDEVLSRISKTMESASQAIAEAAAIIRKV